jgi:hypothetical protein
MRNHRELASFLDPFHQLRFQHQRNRSPSSSLVLGRLSARGVNQCRLANYVTAAVLHLSSCNFTLKKGLCPSTSAVILWKVTFTSTRRHVVPTICAKPGMNGRSQHERELLALAPRNASRPQILEVDGGDAVAAARSLW